LHLVGILFPHITLIRCILYGDILLAFCTNTPVKVVEFWRTV